MTARGGMIPVLLLAAVFASAAETKLDGGGWQFAPDPLARRCRRQQAPSRGGITARPNGPGF
jgi:hypothetical protein